MSVYLYTLRDHKIKPIALIDGEEIPIYHYVYAVSHATSLRWEGEVKSREKYQEKARAIFFPVKESSYWSERNYQTVYYSQFACEPYPKYAKGILVSFTKRKGQIYFQKCPEPNWYDCDDGDGVEVGRFVKGKAIFTEEGLQIIKEHRA